MRVIQTESLKIGDVIGKSLYSENGSLLLAKGVVLTESLIKKIDENHIYYLYIEDEFSKGIEPKGIIDDETMVKSIKSIRDTMSNMFKVGGKTKLAGTIPLKHFFAVQNIVSDLMKSLEENKDALYTVTELMGTDLYTYKHSINVAVLSILVSRSLGYSNDTVRNIAMGGLLHDIGKMKIIADVVNKNGELTFEEFEEMKKHPEYGYEMLKEDKVLAPHTKLIVKYHHEKLDGSGYLNNLKKEAIPEYVGIVTVCDMYDAMTTDRCYRKRMPVFMALETLMYEAVHKIDPKIYHALVDNICIYPIGSMVQLSDGREGLVTEYRAHNPTRPKIRLSDPPFLTLDLENERTLFINNTRDE